MSNNPQHTWNEKQYRRRCPIPRKRCKAFIKLLDKKAKKAETDISSMTPGNVLKGRIVEITKDHVVVDVGLKSEGLVPIEEFSDPSEVVLDGRSRSPSRSSRR